MLPKFAVFIQQLRRQNGEHEQAIFRITFCLLTGIYLLLAPAIDKAALHTAGQITQGYLLLSLLMVTHLFFYPQAIKSRQYLSLILDLSAATLGMIFTQEHGTLIYAVYLWVIVGNGLRYGTPALWISYLVSLIEFISLLFFNPYWSSHLTLFFSLFIPLLIVPLYVLKLRKQLNQAIQNAEAANQAKSLFLAHMSHEMRSPLNGIIGAGELLSYTALNNEQRDLTNTLGNSSKILRQMIDDVLDIAKIEKGKLISEDVDFDLHALLKTTLSLFSQQAQEKGLALQMQCTPDTPAALQGDAKHLTQVLVNLLGNAIKFTQQGCVELNISTLQQNTTRAHLKFTISDTGIGISSQDLTQIFEQFTQANANITIKYGGTGLGTTISRDLVHLMGGEIGVQSELNVGSVFWFQVPFNKQKIDPSVTNPPAAKIISFADYHVAQKRGLDILLADDNDTNRKILSKILEHGGHRVTLAEDGLEALERLLDTTFDLMILDMNMPQMDGLEVVKAHRATTARHARIPVIILTADATLAAMRKCELAAVNAYLTKPIYAQTLLDAVTRLSNHSSPQPLLKSPAAELSSKVIFLNEQSLHQLQLLDEGKGDFLIVVVQGFIAETTPLLKAMHAAWNRQQFSSVKEYAHTLKGSAGNVGAEALSQLCHELMRSDPTELIEQKNDLLEQIQACFNQTKIRLQHYLEHLR